MSTQRKLLVAVSYQKLRFFAYHHRYVRDGLRQAILRAKVKVAFLNRRFYNTLR